MDSGKRITGAVRDKLTDELMKAYESGQSVRTITEDAGRSYGFVHRILTEAGVTLRSRGGNSRSHGV
ncbi:helix-turn-helix domain-containing protein [Streptomyces sp. WM6378]|uniref:helix-turn-helix domain-containing protein n=1 Tax=Streptomyces sp. WM6378 TaxID=1415557 RepID=UPI0006AFED5D|nr:helix-turn-helix domain-containing protein [Streptomyces sp. WM6378]KOU53555.1 transcriptional regulator [Streptomyces sp. WM6378]